MTDQQGTGEAGESALGARIMDCIEALAAISETPDGLTRRYLSPEHGRANALVASWMEEAGMATRVDAVGNLVGRYEARQPGAPALLLGSHLDTVADAGRFDGMLGVVTAIACVAELRRTGRRFDFAIEVIGFCDEEGLRYQSTLLGSRAVAGRFDRSLLDRRDRDGVAMAEAMRAFGLDPERTGDAARQASEFLAYIELHIEQGPVLEDLGRPVGVVTSIAGATRLAVTVVGLAGHAGTVPMALRQDALAAAAELVLAVETRCREEDGLVGTVGSLETRPGAVNVIPGEVVFSVDLRAPEDGSRRRALADLRESFAEIAERRGVTVGIETTHDNPCCPCAPWLVERIAEAVGPDAPCLASGAGHDAMAIADLADVGMIFVRCRGGVSHHPAEHVETADADAGARVLLSLIRNFQAP